MSKILVSLISEQTIPNIVLIREFDFIDKYLFISTEKMENCGFCKWTSQTAGIKPEKQISNLIVDENNYEDIQQKLETLNFEDNDELYVNISGGSKILTIAVHDFFKDLGAKIFFVEPQSMQYIKVFPKSKNKILELKNELNVREYLQAFGFETKNNGTSATQPFEVTQQVFNFFAPYFEPGREKSIYADIISDLQEFRQKKFITLSEIGGLREMITNMKFKTKNPDQLVKEEIVFLTGGWFEEYIFYKIKQELNLKDEFITTGLSIEKDDVPNEFDVVFTLKNRIYSVECKTSVYYYEEGKKRTTIGDFVYKSDSLQSELGLNPSFAIATLSALKDANGILNPIVNTHYKRADLYGIKILAFSELTSGKTFKELLKIK